VVAAGSLLATDVVQAANDKRQLAPMLDKLAALPEDLGQPETLLADTGYFSAANVAACEVAGIAPLIALGREHPSLSERFAEAPPAPENPTLVEAMGHRLKTLEGRKLYAQRKHIPEPVFGIIKSVLGFRQFLLRGLDKRVEPRDHGLESEADVCPDPMRPRSSGLASVAARNVEGKHATAQNGRWTGRPHRETPRSGFSASPVVIYQNA
jgi:hypothetical protein